MKEIKQNGILYAVYDTVDSINKVGSTWYSPNEEPLQASRMVYDKDKSFPVHKHKHNKRVISFTQEALINIVGSSEVEIYNNAKQKIATIILKQGDILLLFNGYHGLKILQDATILYEIKAGSFLSVEKDKEYLND